MLEIVVLVAVTQRIGRVLSSKGRAGGWYKVAAVVLWFVGAFAGAIVGAIVVTLLELNQILIYLAGLGGAFIGAGMVYVVATLAKPTPNLARRIEDEEGVVFF